jgi:hypothetical protein
MHFNCTKRYILFYLSNLIQKFSKYTGYGFPLRDMLLYSPEVSQALLLLVTTDTNLTHNNCSRVVLLYQVPEGFLSEDGIQKSENAPNLFWLLHTSTVGEREL